MVNQFLQNTLKTIVEKHNENIEDMIIILKALKRRKANINLINNVISKISIIDEMIVIDTDIIDYGFTSELQELRLDILLKYNVISKRIDDLMKNT